MATWKSKLERVGSIGPKPRVPAPEPDPAPAPEAGAPTLDVLRDRIARILGKDPPPKPKPSDPTAGDLPFAEDETPLGPLYVRSRRLSAAHRVGRASVRAGAEAAAGMLALLALDPALAACDPSRALYIDTETTGLAGGTGTIPFLIGLAWFARDERGEPTHELVVEQLLLRRLGEEAPMLERLARRVRDASMLVSFNGKSFDLPLLRTRMVLSRMPALVEPPHLDLVHVARRVHKKRIGTCNLGTIESQVLGFGRQGDIPSGEVVSRYAHFLRSGDDSALVAVVDHNDWDVVAMAALVGLYGEPLEGLGAADLVGVARTLKRARSFDLAEEMVGVAVDRGGGDEAVRARGEIAKARGDKARALADYASLVGGVDDPSLRLELAKLYEHHARAPLAALELVEMGTGERPEAVAKRKARLVKKSEKRRR